MRTIKYEETRRVIKEVKEVTKELRKLGIEPKRYDILSPWSRRNPYFILDKPPTG